RGAGSSLCAGDGIDHSIPDRVRHGIRTAGWRDLPPNARGDRGGTADADSVRLVLDEPVFEISCAEFPPLAHGSLRGNSMTELANPVPPAMLDVSDLPESGWDSNDPVWWGNLLAILIETTTIALLIASYFYLRRNFDEWPPPRIDEAPI